MALLLALSAGIAALTIIAFRLETKALIDEHLADLRAIAQVKSDGVQTWLAERSSDVRDFAARPELARELSTARQTGSLSHPNLLLDAMRVEARTTPAEAVMLLDSAGRILLATESTVLGRAALADAAVRAAEAHAPAMVDLAPFAAGGHASLGFVVPVFSDNAEDGKVGFVAFSFAADQYLLPYLAAWPLPSKSGSMSLVERRGEQVVDLTAPAWEQLGAVWLPRATRALDDPDSVVARHFRTGETLLRGRNHRQRDILAAAVPIPGTPWALIVKEELAEASAGLEESAAVTLLLALLMLATACGGVGLLWQRQSLRAARDGLAHAQEIAAIDRRLRESLERAEDELHEKLALQDRWIKLSASVPGLICTFREERDGSCHIPFATPAVEEVLGLAAAEVAQDIAPLQARIHIDDEVRLRRLFKGSTRSLAPFRSGFRYLHPSKGGRWFEVNALPCGADAEGFQWHAFVADVTERRQDTLALRDAAALVARASEGTVVTTLDGSILSINEAFSRITGYAEAEVIGRNMRIFQSGQQDRDFYEVMWHAILTEGSWQGEVVNRRRNGETYPQRLTISVVRDESGEPTSYVGTFTDLSQMKEQESRLQYLASHDPLTGRANRVVLHATLQHAAARAVQQGAQGAVLFLGLDRFKTVNDSLGHTAGDEALRLAAERIASCLSEADTLARFGGDEFVVVLEDLTGADQAARLACTLIERMAEPITLADGQALYLGLSIGIALFPADGATADDLLRDADAALHKAKAEGRGTFRFFTAAMTEKALEKLRLEARLRRAVERQEFVLHYQPLVVLADRRIRGVEALIRWNDPVHGQISPGQFIPLAEETGLIIPMGYWVLREACSQMQRWRESGVLDGVMAVNLSPIQFRSGDLVEQVGRVLAETGLPPGQLELEITEGALVEDAAAAADILVALKRLGLRLSIDDFGTGYSSLAYLKRFPIDKLKIDQGFVRGLPDDLADVEIANAIIGLADSLHIDVLAEGVETEAQALFLLGRGCRCGQGYLFGRPVPPEALAALCCGAA